MSLCAIGLLMWGCVDRAMVPDTQMQLQADIETIDNYLSLNNITAIQDKSGVRFQIERLGTGGLPPKIDQTVKVNYRGYLMNGNVFDNGGNAVEVVNQFISGWQLTLIVWPVGTKGKVWVPSPLGYGNQAVGSIPANSILVFDVELLEVQPSNTEKARLTSDIAIVDKYLSDNSINAVQDTTGVRYVITEPGTGPAPTWYDKVRFSYSGRNLATGTEFFSGTAEPTDTFDSRMVDYLHGIKIALSKIGKGGKITIYVPSGLAFGPYENSQAGLPANSNVYYTIELLEIY